MTAPTSLTFAEQGRLVGGRVDDTVSTNWVYSNPQHSIGLVMQTELGSQVMIRDCRGLGYTDRGEEYRAFLVGVIYAPECRHLEGKEVLLRIIGETFAAEFGC